MNVVGHLGLAVGLQLPFIKALSDHQTALIALPRAAIAGGGLHGLDAGVDGRVLRRYAVRKERDQSPTQPKPLAPAFPDASASPDSTDEIRTLCPGTSALAS